MELLLTEIERLKPYEQNPRMITEDHVAKLCGIIEANGFLDPIEVDANWTIVAGHTRYLAAKKMNLVRVPVILHERMTQDEARLYRIAHNKAADTGEWNRELLSNEMLSLEHLIGGPGDAGFDGDELLKLFDLDRGAGEDIEADGAPDDADPGPYIEHGQVWKMGPVTFEVYKNLSKDQLRKAEATIIKLQKMMKEPAMLGDVTLKEYLATAQNIGAVP